MHFSVTVFLGAILSCTVIPFLFASQHHLDVLCYARSQISYLSPCSLNYFDKCVNKKLSELSLKYLHIKSTISNRTQSYQSCSTNFPCVGKTNINRLQELSACKSHPNGTYLWAVTVVKNDANTVLQWVSWHLLLGFDHLVIYDNNSTDNIRESLQPFIQYGYVEVHNNDDIIAVPAQIRTYNLVLQKCKKLGITWLATIDVDEYIVLYKHTCMKDFLQRYESNSTIGGIAINWRRMTPPKGKIWMTRNETGGAIFKTIMEEQELFTGESNLHIKTIAFVNRTTGYTHMHFAKYIPTATAVSPTLLRAITSAVNKPPDDTDATLLHFHTRSFEEYLYKMRRWEANSHIDRICKGCKGLDFRSHGLEYSRWINTSAASISPVIIGKWTRKNSANSTNMVGAIKPVRPKVPYASHPATENFMRLQSEKIHLLLNC
eukprot:gene2493-4849_t